MDAGRADAADRRWRLLATSRRCCCSSACLAGIAFTAVSPSSAAAAARRIAARGSSGPGFTVTVEPGNTEVERGTSLLVLARVAGQMPPEATLVMRPVSGEESRLAMSASLNDPVFGGRIPVVDEPLDYADRTGRPDDARLITSRSLSIRGWKRPMRG